MRAHKFIYQRPLRYNMANNTVDLTPSPQAYIRMLRIIAERSTQYSDRVWARNQLIALGEEEE